MNKNKVLALLGLSFLVGTNVYLMIISLIPFVPLQVLVLIFTMFLLIRMTYKVVKVRV